LQGGCPFSGKNGDILPKFDVCSKGVNCFEEQNQHCFSLNKTFNEHGKSLGRCCKLARESATPLNLVQRFVFKLLKMIRFETKKYFLHCKTWLFHSFIAVKPTVYSSNNCNELTFLKNHLSESCC